MPNTTEYLNNSAWAFALIDQLIQQGVTHFCIAPGSRNTALALAVARHESAHLTVHFDERGLGFYALGQTLGNRLPTAIIVTSGTAVGNLLPAVMEAHHSRIPFLLLTADRPAELRDCEANQTTDQIKLFANFTLWQTDLPCPGPFLTEAFIRSQASHAVFCALKGGPVHLNCPFREPLFERESSYPNGQLQPLFFPTFGLDSAAKEYATRCLKATNRGLILIGRTLEPTDLTPIFRLSQTLRWPIFADLLSQARPVAPPELIRHFDYAIRTKSVPSPECILHFGGRFTSKALPEWIQRQQATTLHISSHPERVDPLHSRPARIWADPAQFCAALEIAGSREQGWLTEWQEIDEEIHQKLETSFEEPHPFVEADLMRTIGQELPSDWAIFLANSMPIRDAEHFLFPGNARAFFSNRGVSGIDGQIATAAGIAQTQKRPLIAIIGDQSSLHDLNSFALLKKIETPFLLVISNNFGGGIFSHLPVAQEAKHFDRLWGVSHDFSFEKIAEMFDLPYLTSLRFDLPGPAIAEIFTSREKNTCFQKKILEKCSCTEDKIVQPARV